MERIGWLKVQAKYVNPDKAQKTLVTQGMIKGCPKDSLPVFVFIPPIHQIRSPARAF